MGEVRDFGEMGRAYQEKLVHALFEDPVFSSTMADVIDVDYFTFVHLKGLSKILFEYRTKYRDFPSFEVALMQFRQQYADDPAAVLLAAEAIRQMKEVPLNGDKGWIQDSALEFCKRQALIKALSRSLEHIEGKKYDSIAGTIREALDKGMPQDQGHEYLDEIDRRAELSVREPISTGWPVLDKYLNGGWERKTISTFIAPTGAGKSMFLVNAACALVEQGFNVLYVTLEMADFKIGLRCDSWFSGISIDDVSKKREAVKGAIGEKAKGRLIIKEWPTKRATVETIRSHVQRLQTKGFKPDAIIVDYPDLLRAVRSYGEKRHELEGNYEELRGLAQELNCVMIVADQTNRGGLDLELVTISAIAEAYSKATVCDLIITISRTPDDKFNGTGRLFIAKSRLGSDGVVLPFLLRTSQNVRVTVLDHDVDPVTMLMQANGEEGMKNFLAGRIKKLKGGDEK